MTVTRLTGGLTPGDAGDPRTFPEIFNAAADVIDASEAGLSVVEGDVGSLQSDVGTLQDDVVELETRGFRIVETLYFTSSGTFTKADFPFLRAVRVKCQGGGGGGAGARATASNETMVSRGGSGGGFSESFITDIVGLDASVTVTRGAGGAGGAAGANAGSGGQSSFFGALVVANGGNAGSATLSSSFLITFNGVVGGSAGVGDLALPGMSSYGPFGLTGAQGNSGPGADSLFGSGGVARVGGGGNGLPGSGFGSGGGGAKDRDEIDRSGGNGANGIVIVELFA